MQSASLMTIFSTISLIAMFLLLRIEEFSIEKVRAVFLSHPR